MLDQLTEFVNGMPGWVGQDGLPLSWSHFNYGLKYLRRKTARDSLEMSSAVRMGGNVKNDDYQEWRRDKNMMAGYT